MSCEADLNTVCIPSMATLDTDLSQFVMVGEGHQIPGLIIKGLKLGGTFQHF